MKWLVDSEAETITKHVIELFGWRITIERI